MLPGKTRHSVIVYTARTKINGPTGRQHDLPYQYFDDRQLDMAHCHCIQEWISCLGCADDTLQSARANLRPVALGAMQGSLYYARYQYRSDIHPVSRRYTENFQGFRYRFTYRTPDSRVSARVAGMRKLRFNGMLQKAGV
jgi:hypothetical protein